MIQDRISQFKRDFSSHTELRSQVNTTRRIGFLGGNLVTNLRSEQGGVSARVYEGGVYGFSKSSIFSSCFTLLCADLAVVARTRLRST